MNGVTGSVAVVKVGGSVLDGLEAYRRVAAAFARRLARRPHERVVVVVSAERGVTDALADLARSFTPSVDPRALDLLWSTGEQRSVALLTLALQAAGVGAVALDVHEVGLEVDPSGGEPGPRVRVNPLRLLAVLARFRAVVVPGFFAVGLGGTVVSLGRGGSDLTAVVLAAALGAGCCELVKDVPGYFTADPARCPDAVHRPTVSFDEALAMADAGSRLVQRAALEVAARERLSLVVRTLDEEAGATVVGAEKSVSEGGVSVGAA